MFWADLKPPGSRDGPLVFKDAHPRVLLQFYAKSIADDAGIPVGAEFRGQMPAVIVFRIDRCSGWGDPPHRTSASPFFRKVIAIMLR